MARADVARPAVLGGINEPHAFGAAVTRSNGTTAGLPAPMPTSPPRCRRAAHAHGEALCMSSTLWVPWPYGPRAHVVEAEADEAFSVCSPVRLDVGPSSTRHICLVDEDRTAGDSDRSAGAMEHGEVHAGHVERAGPRLRDREVLQSACRHARHGRRNAHRVRWRNSTLICVTTGRWGESYELNIRTNK